MSSSLQKSLQALDAVDGLSQAELDARMDILRSSKASGVDITDALPYIARSVLEELAGMDTSVDFSDSVSEDSISTLGTLTSLTTHQPQRSGVRERMQTTLDTDTPRGSTVPHSSTSIESAAKRYSRNDSKQEQLSKEEKFERNALRDNSARNFDVGNDGILESTQSSKTPSGEIDFTATIDTNISVPSEDADVIGRADDYERAAMQEHCGAAILAGTRKYPADNEENSLALSESSSAFAAVEFLEQSSVSQDPPK
jgi:hypothetical protein